MRLFIWKRFAFCYVLTYLYFWTGLDLNRLGCELAYISSCKQGLRTDFLPRISYQERAKNCKKGYLPDTARYVQEHWYEINAFHTMKAPYRSEIKDSFQYMSFYLQYTLRISLCLTYNIQHYNHILNCFMHSIYICREHKYIHSVVHLII